MDQLRMFSVQEANALIPALDVLIENLQEKKANVLRHEAHIDALEIIGSRKEGQPCPAVDRALDAYETAVNDFYSVVDEIHRMGCFLKDVDKGLVDFYTMHQGRVVYLCWSRGEREVRCWHEIGQGFLNRQPLHFDCELGN